MNGNRYYGVRVEGAKYGVGFGSALGIAISYTANHSMLRATTHGIWGWLYVIYFALFRIVISLSWHQWFSDPIILPGRKPLVTLRDAANYIVKLPKVEQRASQWQATAEVLMLIGEHGLR